MPKPYQSRAEYYYGALTEGYDGELPKPQSREDYYLLKLIEQMGNISSKSVMTPKGSITFATLPSPASAELGDYYNVSDSFTTTSDFIEGAGHKNEAGTNVGLVLDSDGNKKWDCFGMNFTVTDKLYSKQNYHDPMSPYAMLNAYGTTGLIIPSDYGFTHDVAIDIKMPNTVWFGAYWLDEDSITIKDSNIDTSFIFSPEGGFGFYKKSGETDPASGKNVVSSSTFIGQSMQVYVGTGVVSEVTAVGIDISVGATSGAVLVGKGIKAIGKPSGNVAFGNGINAGSDGFSGKNIPVSTDTCFYGTKNDVIYLDAPWTAVTGTPKVVVGAGSTNRRNAIEFGYTGCSFDEASIPQKSSELDAEYLMVRPYSYTTSDGTVKKRYVMERAKCPVFNEYRTAGSYELNMAISASSSASIYCWANGLPVYFHPTDDGSTYEDGCVRVVYAIPDEDGLSGITHQVALLFDRDGSIYRATGPSVVGFTKWVKLFGASGGAAKLETAVTINGVPFDGTENINIGLDDAVWNTGSSGNSVTPPYNETYVDSHAQNNAILVSGPGIQEIVGTIKTKSGVTIPKGSILLYTSWTEYSSTINRSTAPRRETVVPCMCEHGFAGHLVFSSRTLTSNDVARFYPSSDFASGDTIRYNYFQVRNVENKRANDTGEFVTLL